MRLSLANANIIVKNIPEEIKKSDIMQLFSEFGQVLSVGLY